jgi:hypothetical protein
LHLVYLIATRSTSLYQASLTFITITLFPSQNLIVYETRNISVYIIFHIYFFSGCPLHGITFKISSISYFHIKYYISQHLNKTQTLNWYQLFLLDYNTFYGAHPIYCHIKVRKYSFFRSYLHTSANVLWSLPRRKKHPKWWNINALVNVLIWRGFDFLCHWFLCLIDISFSRSKISISVK